MSAYIDDERPKDTDTTLLCQFIYQIESQTHIRYVHEHGEHKVQVGSRVEESLSYLVPLPRVISDTLGIAADTVDCDRLLSIVKPSDLQLGVGKGISVKDTGEKGKEAKLRQSVMYCT